MRLLFIFLIVISSAQVSLAKKVKLFGKHIAYANTQIKVLCYDDALSKTEKQLAIIQIDEAGEFSVEFELTETQIIFLPLGIFRGYFFAEANKEYQLSLPPKRDLSPAQNSDPFFETQDVLLGFRNTYKDDLNNLIRKFDNQFDQFINQNFGHIYNQAALSIGVEFTKQIKSEYAYIKHSYFQSYLFYRLGYLEYLANPEAYISIENKYFNKKNLLLNNIAYTTLFNKIYNNALASAFHRREKSKFNEAIESDDVYTELNNIMKTYPVYQDKSFRDILLAKSTFEGAENALFSRRKAIAILNKINLNSQDQRVRRLTTNYLKKLTHLLKSTQAPSFKVGEFSLKNYKGKYVYLNFCNTSNSVWENDFELLKKLHKSFGKYVEFLSIANDTDSIGFKGRLKEHEISWPVILIDENNSVLDDYKIKVFPTYIIINPEGKIFRYPARSPHDGVEKDFINIQRMLMRKRHSEK